MPRGKVLGGSCLCGRCLLWHTILVGGKYLGGGCLDGVDEMPSVAEGIDAAVADEVPRWQTRCRGGRCHSSSPPCCALFFAVCALPAPSRERRDYTRCVRGDLIARAHAVGILLGARWCPFSGEAGILRHSNVAINTITRCESLVIQL